MIPIAYRENFNTLLKAAESGRLALLECRDAKRPDLPRYVIAAVSDDADDPEGIIFVPFGHLYDNDGNQDGWDPFSAYLPPNPDDPESFLKPEDSD